MHGAAMNMAKTSNENRSVAVEGTVERMILRSEIKMKSRTRPAHVPVGRSFKTPHLDNDANLNSRVENNPTWTQNIQALLEYKARHGTVNLPERSKDYPNLGRWVFNMRMRKHLLTPEEVDELTRIGFLWTNANQDKLDQKWMIKFRQLKQYKKYHGNCMVPRGYKDNRALGAWVSVQRKRNLEGEISPNRKEMLDQIGFVWQLRDDNCANSAAKKRRNDLKWMKKYLELCQYKEQHNHTNVPNTYAANQSLATWVSLQRLYFRRRLLHKDRQELLQELGFVFDLQPIRDEAWMQQYTQLKKCKQEGLPLGKELRSWMTNQRLIFSKGSLNPKRKDLLDQIDFEWWEER